MRIALYLTIAIILAVFICLIGDELASATTYESACSVTEAHARVHKAARAARRAEARLAEARRVLGATRGYNALYGAGVARWVWLARQSGYQWWEFPILMRVIDRESSGSPTVPNADGSGALGMLQVMPEWADGSKGWYWKQWGLPAAWDRTSPVSTLRHCSHMAWSNWGE